MSWHLISALVSAYYVSYPLTVLFLSRRLRWLHSILSIVLALVGIWAFTCGSITSVVLSSGIGLAYLPFTVGMTSPSFAYFLRFRYAFQNWARTVSSEFKGYVPLFLQTFKEELVWRSAFIYLGRFNGIPDPLLLVLGAFLFYLIHWNPKGRIVIMTEMELLAFSFLLYFVYMTFETLIGVWLIHSIRNSYLRFYRSQNHINDSQSLEPLGSVDA